MPMANKSSSKRDGTKVKTKKQRIPGGIHDSRKNYQSFGPLVVASGMQEANIQDICRVGIWFDWRKLLRHAADEASIQVYEETSGVGPGEPVVATELPFLVELGPGLISSDV